MNNFEFTVFLYYSVNIPVCVCLSVKYVIDILIAPSHYILGICAVVIIISFTYCVVRPTVIRLI